MTALIGFLLALLGGLIGAWLGLRVFTRTPDPSATLSPLLERLERSLREDSVSSRREHGEAARAQRAELAQGLQQFGQQLAEAQRQLLEEARAGRGEQRETLTRFGDGQSQGLQQLAEAQRLQAEALRGSVETGLKVLRQENTEKLEQMRRTVDEKLHESLEKRLGDSFKLVSERLEQVHRGLGEMQTLATGVGDLKRVLGNVKVRGIFGEGQLAALLEQALTVEQYAANVAVQPGSAERVEFAIRLPGRGNEAGTIWLPIDAKFPREDYERLVEAQDRGDVEVARLAGIQLERAVRAQARTIGEKYVCPPHTTDFAVMFLPTEGLYAEVLRRPGLFEALQREHRVNVAGPTTLLAILNSLQMGFRTLAIEQRSSEVWQVLGAVKSEFGKFGEVLDKVKKKLDEASSQIEQTGVRSRAITRKLREVQALPAGDTERLLGAAAAPEDEPEPGER